MILTTLINRPYVFIFLLAYLFIGIRSQGNLRTFLFLIIGYTIAWISEASSIRTGFPYGWYFYIYENLQGEWLNWGVPVWDSLSYTFLCFAGYSLASLVLKKSPSRFKLTLLSAFLVVLLDIVIDPLAHLGEKWFLGKIYYYPEPGFYFDVPISNFLGWFLVAFVIVGFYLFMDSLLKKPKQNSSLFIDRYGGSFLYFGIFLFNWGITLWIGEWTLAVVDLLVISIPILLLIVGGIRPQIFSVPDKENLFEQESSWLRGLNEEYLFQEDPPER